MIEKNSNLSFPRGKGIRYYNIPIITKDILKSMDQNILKQELLLIVDSKEDALELIDKINYKFKFISLIGLYGKESKDIYKEVLEDYGISIFQPENLKNNLNNYDVIINTSEKKCLNNMKIKKRAIVFDFSLSRSLQNLERKNIIQDIKLKIKDQDLKENPWIDRVVTADVYEGLFKEEFKEYYQIIIKDDIKDYYLDDYIDKNIKIKGIY
ncbi:MAG TPA: hypothetical protein VK087_04510 [Tissierellaceae bacterium]|nr:hypothetical protein [Tissierellaceae bacterium]